MVSPTSDLAPVHRAALALQSFCDERGWRACFIGGLALQRWGEPRLTVDADLTLLTGFGGEERFVDALLGRFKGREADAREFALLRRVLLLEDEEGTGLDIALGGLPFEERTIERSSRYDFGVSGRSVRLNTCCPEDLVVHKCFAARAQDWLDVRGILIRQRGKLDLALVRRELAPLVELKGEPEILKRLEALVAEAAA
jgi:hypothetical protein